jgi:hypothetical protein
MAFKAFWFIPVVALMTADRGQKMYTFALFFWMFFAGAGQLICANDTSRHLGHSFPMILYALEMLLARKEVRNGVLEVLVLLVLVNFFVPQHYIGQQTAYPFLPLPVSLFLWVFGLEPWHLRYAPWN